ncbi:MAG: PD-(D/E)XK nuclease family protein, partial [Tumebacillaceae bacterium]
GEIAILTNRAFASGSVAHRVLKREGVPVQQAVSLTAEKVPWVRDLLALYTLEDEEWHRDTLQQLAGADWLLGDHPLQGRETVPQRAARQFGVVKGLATWQARLQEALHRMRDGGEQEREDWQAMLTWLDQLAGKVRALPAEASGQAHVQALKALLNGDTLYDRLVERFNAGVGYTAEYLQRDLRARDALESVLRDVERMEHSIGDAGTYSRVEFAQLLWNHLSAEEMVVERGKRFGVAYLNPSAARGLSFAHVFFVGLNEGEWPQPPATPWLMRESLREELAEQMPMLSPQVQTDQQKLFFLMGLHTAREGVSMSYVGGSKQDLPSRFLDQLFELCPSLEQQVQEDEYLGGSLLFPVQQSDISNVREARDWMADQLANGVLSAEAMLLVEPAFWQQVLAQAQSERERATTREVNRFDGLLGDAAIREELAERFSTEQVYSVSQFNRYGECGYKFYLSRVLRMETEQEEEEELSALEKGNLYHKVLHRLYEHVVDVPKITPHVIEDLRARLPVIFEQEWSRSQALRQTEVGMRQELEKERLLRRLRDWFEGEAEAWQTMGLPLKPRYLEWVFGMSSGSDQDPNSSTEPITVGQLKFRGQIDRIDATEDGTYFLVDYKSKNTKQMPKAIENGIDFQLPVYLRAVEQTLFPEGTAVGAAYYSIEKVDRTSSALVKEEFLEPLGMGKKRNKLDGEQWEALLQHTEQTLEAYRLQMADGHFPVAPSDEANCKYCEYRRICRYDRMRALNREVAATKSEEGGEQIG